MPRIRDLKRFLRRHDRFKVIHRDYYERRWYGFANEVRVFSLSDGVEVTVFHGWGTADSKVFSNLSEAIDWIKREYPPEYYVYYYYVPRFTDEGESNQVYINLRSVFGFTIDEAEAWKLILARAMGHLNGRRLIGFRILKNTSKNCGCGNKAVIQAVFDYHGRKYGEYYCNECWKEEVNALFEKLGRKIKAMKERMQELPKVIE